MTDDSNVTSIHWTRMNGIMVNVMRYMSGGVPTS